MLTIKPFVALICARTRVQGQPSSLRVEARCLATTKKYRVMNGQAVVPSPSGMTGAWAILALVFGLPRGVATVV